jgi:hypothetical protein
LDVEGEWSGLAVLVTIQSLLLSLGFFSQAISSISCTDLVDYHRRHFPQFDIVAELKFN